MKASTSTKLIANLASRAVRAAVKQHPAVTPDVQRGHALAQCENYFREHDLPLTTEVQIRLRCAIRLAFLKVG
jgi:hypothetical protein